jgi:hypothetical protein
VVNLDGRKRIEMHAENLGAANKFSCLHRIVRTIVKLSPTHNAANFSFVNSPMSFMSSVGAVSPE